MQAVREDLFENGLLVLGKLYPNLEILLRMHEVDM